MRLLGLDYGQKRIGIAISDPLFIIASPHGFFLRDKTFFEKILTLIQEYEVSEIVIGYPKSLSGQPSAMAKEVEAFSKELSKHVSQPIHFWDERMTTAETEKLLISANRRREERKVERDAIAASLILQGFMAARENQQK